VTGRVGVPAARRLETSGESFSQALGVGLRGLELHERPLLRLLGDRVAGVDPRDLPHLERNAGQRATDPQTLGDQYASEHFSPSSLSLNPGSDHVMHRIFSGGLRRCQP
jgi:hypothetical protein